MATVLQRCRAPDGIEVARRDEPARVLAAGGGRVIFRQGGPEPLHACHVFLEERQARGDFETLNKDLEAALGRHDRTDTLHSFYRPGSKEEAGSFRGSAAAAAAVATTKFRKSAGHCVPRAGASRASRPSR